MPTTAQFSGRVVAETPTGEKLLLLGAFNGGPTVKTSFSFSVPPGPFRIAIYG